MPLTKPKLPKPKPTFKKSGSLTLDIPRLSSKRKSRGEWLRVKDFLDGFVAQVKTPQFRVRDPIFYPAQHLAEPETAEWVGFLSALFSYGRREKIMENLAWIFQRMEGDPKGFLETFHPKKDRKVFQGFVYRFNREEDLLGLCCRLQKVIQRYGSLEQLYLNASPTISNEDPKAFQLKLGAFMDAFIDLEPLPAGGLNNGLKFLLSHPERKGACKRLNMFLRWVVREDLDPAQQVDLGLWKQHAILPKDLIIPLDTHVAQMARKLNLTQRQANDWQTAEEITEIFRHFCPEDPTVYDFAMFGFDLFMANRL